MLLGSNQVYTSPEEVLKHHGIKGMRWGVRNDTTAARRNEEEKSKLASALTGKAAFGAGSTMDHGVPSMTLMGNDLTVDRSKGYAEFRPPGFPANAAVARRHGELIAALDEVRAAYPAVAKMNIEVVPMSRVPHAADQTASSFASVQGVKKGEARIMYNDKLGELELYQTQFVNNYMPGITTKNYLGYHEMGHLLAAAHGTFPPSHATMAKGLTSRNVNKFDKLNQKQHKALLKQHGLSFKQVRKLSPYAATMPSEAVAELVAHGLSPQMRATLDPDTRRKVDALINTMGGV